MADESFVSSICNHADLDCWIVEVVSESDHPLTVHEIAVLLGDRLGTVFSEERIRKRLISMAKFGVLDRILDESDYRSRPKLMVSIHKGVSA